MARIQILELPTEHHGDDMITPFVLVIDQANEEEAEHYAATTDALKGFRDDAGARAVLVTTTTIEIPANWAHTDGDSIEGGTLHIKVDADLDDFREQVQAAVNDAQRRLGTALHAPKPAPEPTPPPDTTP